MHASSSSAPTSQSAVAPFGTVTLGRSGLLASRVTLGTMTFGEQVGETAAHAILDRAVERGVTMLDTAEMYPVPPSAQTYGATESIIGRWLAKRPSSARSRLLVATKVAGPTRGMAWVRGGADDITPEGIVQACEDSLRRLAIDTIDLYQIHWPNRTVPMFGGLYLPRPVPSSVEGPGAGKGGADGGARTSIEVQLEALGRLVRAGKVRAIGVSNETPFGVAAFVHAAEQHGLPRIATVQNAYALTNRVPDNGLDEAMHALDVSLLAYSPLAFGALTGKYDAKGVHDASNPGRLAAFERFRTQRWARVEAIDAARRYNALAREHGFAPARMALAWVYGNWRVASTIIGVTSLAQLDECLDAWGTSLSKELLDAIDAIRWERRDPAQ
jgi:aryl-alcohol dehydrogenase-like predicted oxidoreductase